ncbi:MAG: flagellar biosynthetic protein FliO [Deltaproteobacteria bacterium]|nr:flagellar biosynthetic protein FliO [Deltaproteobacteria bacterium]
MRLLPRQAFFYTFLLLGIAVSVFLPVTAQTAPAAQGAKAPAAQGPALIPTQSPETGGTTPPAPLGGYQDNWMSSLVTMILSLVFVLGLFYTLAILYKKLAANRPKGGAGAIPIEFMGSYALGPRHRVVVLNIDGQKVVCGVTPQNISFLTKLDDSEQTDSNPTGGGPRAGEQGNPLREKTRQFADALKNKMRSMKRLP